MMTEHNTKVIKQFTIATIFWGIIGMLVGSILPRNWLGRRSILTFLGSHTAVYGHYTPTQ